MLVEPWSSAATIAWRSRGDLVVADDDPALGRELADRAVVRVDAGDGVRRVVVERGNLGQVGGEDEEDTAQSARGGRRHEHGHDAGVVGEARNRGSHARI